uniref:Uncharacterized protein n=1 Tax=Nelumbo nucifera TaxID=4432 RepID=A0A822YQP0_NELNU|nr:TPA_asm: hypothetical protein HUJ06_007145 [Nelumbo nucifera]
MQTANFTSLISDGTTRSHAFATLMILKWHLCLSEGIVCVSLSY